MSGMLHACAWSAMQVTSPAVSYVCMQCSAEPAGMTYTMAYALGQAPGSRLDSCLTRTLLLGPASAATVAGW